MAERLCYSCMKIMVGEACSCEESKRERGLYPSALKPGTRLKNDFVDYRYTLGHAMGSGGFGIVYVALDEKNDRKVAIKEFFPRDDARRSASDSKRVLYEAGKEAECEAWKNRFLEEAMNLASFRGEKNIVSIVDVFQENNTAYIVMEYVSGVTLSSYIKGKGVFTEDEILQLMEPVMVSLARVHKQGIIHRDISPDNIMIGKDEAGKNVLTLIDFGAASERNSSRLASRVVRDSFSAPELYRGVNIGTWSDVYSLCATIYYCLTGQAPLGEKYRKKDNKELVMPNDCPTIKNAISKSFEDAIVKGLSISRNFRQQTIGELLKEFGLKGAELVSDDIVKGEEIKERVKGEDGISDRPASVQKVVKNGADQKKKNNTKRNVGIVVGALLLCFLFWNAGKWYAGRLSDDRGSTSIEAGESNVGGKEDTDGITPQAGATTQSPDSGDEVDVTNSPALVQLSVFFNMLDEKSGQNVRIKENSIEIEAGKSISLEPYFPEFESYNIKEEEIEYEIVSSRGIVNVDTSSSVPAVTVGEGMTGEILINCVKKKYDFSVIWDSDYADISGMGEFHAGELVTIKFEVKDGYVLEGYTGDFQKTFSKQIKGTYSYIFEMPSDDVTIEAIIKADSFRLSFDSQGGSKVADIDVVYGEEFALPKGPSKEGYIFNGWYTKSSGGDRVRSGEIVQILSDMTLYAHWEARDGILYTVNHYQQKASGSGYVLFSEEVMRGNSDEKITLSSLANEYNGFKYVGAYAATKASDTPDSYVKTSTVLPNGTRVINMYYDRNQYMMAFDANGGILLNNTKSVTMGAEVGTLPVPTRDYYTFNGWYTKTTGGTRITSEYKMESADIKVYAQWTANNESDWVLTSAVPNDAKITDTKWNYTLTETKESKNSYEEGWENTGFYWKDTGSHSVRYASFPYGFNTEDPIYQGFAKEPVAAYENETSRREVINEWTGYIYWHWMYDVQYASVTNRAISHRSGSWDSYGNEGVGLNYKYFHAFESAVDCPYLDILFCCSQNIPSYNCVNVIPDKSALGVGCNRYFRFDAYTSYYTDYEKVYQHKKVSKAISLTEVENGGQISDVVKYVKYIEK